MAKEKNQVFRKSAMERVSSPEQLNEYIRVSNPGVWMVLAAIVLLLLGTVVWGVLGRMETTLSAVSVTENGQTVVYVKEADIAAIEEGMTVRIGDAEGVVAQIRREPVRVDDSFSQYILHLGGLTEGEWVYAVVIEGVFGDGIYQAEIVTESVAPMSFILN